MSDSIMHRHGLEPLIDEFAGGDTGSARVQIAVLGDTACINLRGNPDDEDFTDAAEQALGQALPVQPNTASRGEHRVFWLGPDEWLVMTDLAVAPALAKGLGDAVAGMTAAVNDVSGGNVTLELRGPACRELLAKGCTLDLHESEFSVGDCAQSGLAKASVLLALIDAEPVFLIVVRRSFSDYLCRWLHHAGREFGITLKAG